MDIKSILGTESSFSTMDSKERAILSFLLKAEMEKREDSRVCKQIKDIVPIEQWLESPYFVGEDGVRIYDYWKETIKEVFDSKVPLDKKCTELVMSGCFTGDTKISLLDGRELTMEELCNEYGMSKEFWVYSVDTDNCIKPGRAFNVRKTGINRELVAVTLDNGEVIRCTPDHRFMLRDGSYQQAKDLKSGTSLMPLYREYTKQEGEVCRGVSDGYERVYNPCIGRYDATHRVVANCVHALQKDKVLKDYTNEHPVIHHINFKKTNNSPDNLVWMGNKQHFKYHHDVIQKNFKDPKTRAKMINNMSKASKRSWDMDDGSRRQAYSLRMKIMCTSPEYVNGHLKELHECIREYMNTDEGKDLARRNIAKWNSGESFSPEREKDRILSMVVNLKKWWNSPEGVLEKEKRRERMIELNKNGQAKMAANLYWSTGDVSEKKRKKAELCVSRNSEEGFILKASTNRSKAVRAKNRAMYESMGLTFEELCRAMQVSVSWEDLAKILNTAFNTTFYGHSLEKLFKAYDVDDRDDLLLKLKPSGYYKNHKVVSVEFLDYVEDVYDFEVEEYHNFALSSGVFVHNSIGIGKTTIAQVCVCRKIYELSCYQNIPAMFNMMSSSPIVFLYFSVNKNQAELTGFGNTRSMIDRIPYFTEEFPRNEKVNSLLLFPENIMITFGSGSNDAIGMNVIMNVLDEANFHRGESRGGGDGSGHVAALYASIVSRSKSRFVAEGGKDSSLNVLISSATHESSFTEQRIKMAQDDPKVIVKAPTLWEVKPKAYSADRFFVFKGSKSSEPYIVKSILDVDRYVLSEMSNNMYTYDPSTDDIYSANFIDKCLKKLPEHMQERFLKVPTDLKKSFELNIVQALQDIGGVSIAPSGRLFTSEPVFSKSIHPDFSHPFVSDIITVSTGDDVQIWEFLKKDLKFKKPHLPRFIHIDQSVVTDRAGISCVYIDELRVEKNGDGNEATIVPVIGVDFKIAIQPPQAPKRIAIYKIRNFILYLREIKKVKYGMVSYDIYASEESRQILDEQGVPIRYRSVDRTDEAYLSYITMLYEERIRDYEHPLAKQELFNLIHDRSRRKIDHPKSNGDGSVGTKDLMDSLVGAIANAIDATYKDSAEPTSLLDGFLKSNNIYYNEKKENDLMSCYSYGDKKSSTVDTMIDRALYIDED